MTNAGVTMVGYSYQNVTKTSMSMSQSKEDFKNVMDVAGSRLDTGKTESRFEKDYDKGTVEKVDEYTDKTGKAEEAYKTEKSDVHEKEPVEEKSEVNVTDEEKAVVEEAAEEAVKAVADELGVDMEEVLEALEVLGMSVTDILNVDNLKLLVATVAGEQDPLMLAMNEQLYSQLNAVTEIVNGVNAGLQETFSLSDEELQMILDKLKGNQAEDVADVNEMLKGSVNPVNETELADDVSKELSETVDGKSDADEMNTVSGDVKQNASQKVETESSFTRGEEENAGKEAGKETLQNQTSNNAAMQNVLQFKGVTNAEIPMVQELLGRNEVDGLNIIRQISDYMNLQKSADLTQMELQLHPASLGTINLTVSSKAGIITATIEAQNEAVKNALETQIVTLKENLEQQGLKVEAVEVTVASHEFERNLDGNSEDRDAYTNEAENKIKRRPLRRIDLNAAEDMEDIEEAAEEKIIRDMMRINGNTVDYTA